MDESIWNTKRKCVGIWEGKFEQYDKFEFGGGIVMGKYVLCLVTILLVVVDAFIYFNLKKYIKLHENELVENNIKGLLGRVVVMTIISVCVGIIAIILQVM